MNSYRNSAVKVIIIIILIFIEIEIIIVIFTVIVICIVIAILIVIVILEAKFRLIWGISVFDSLLFSLCISSKTELQ